MRNYFGGWYFKCQNSKQTLAVISAFHITQGKPSASIQLITNEGAWNIPYPADEYHKSQDGFTTRIGENRFGKTSIRISIHTDYCQAEGILKFGAFTSIKYDIMGPFCLVPFMECRHSVGSMIHTVTGRIVVNGIEYRFNHDLGYLEGDRGRSFPREYLWTHCFFENKNSVMLSVADIPIGPIRFTGLLCVIWYRGKEYRLATYLGARAVSIKGGKAVIRQGSRELTVELLEKHAHPLYAPRSGAMVRTIRESASCVASYTYREKGKTLFSFVSDQASFEYEYPQ